MAVRVSRHRKDDSGHLDFVEIEPVGWERSIGVPLCTFTFRDDPHPLLDSNRYRGSTVFISAAEASGKYTHSLREVVFRRSQYRQAARNGWPIMSSRCRLVIRVKIYLFGIFESRFHKETAVTGFLP